MPSPASDALLRRAGRSSSACRRSPALFGYHDEQLGHFRRYTRATLRIVLEPRLHDLAAPVLRITFIPVTAWF